MMENKKGGVGLWEQLSPERMQQVNEMWQARMAMTTEEKIEDFKARVLRGLKMLEEAAKRLNNC